jgi:hypothetical protein
MELNYLYVTAGLLGLGGIIILVFVGLLAWNKHLIVTGQHPQLRLFLTQAITMAYKLSDDVFDITEKRLHFEQKREVLAVIYDMLPDVISLKIINLKWKQWVSKAEFVEFVALQYEKLIEQYSALNKQILREMVEAMES